MFVFALRPPFFLGAVIRCPSVSCVKLFRYCRVFLSAVRLHFLFFLREGNFLKQFFNGWRKQALLQFLVCAVACANCKCACFGVGYFSFPYLIIWSFFLCVNNCLLKLFFSWLYFQRFSCVTCNSSILDELSI